MQVRKKFRRLKRFVYLGAVTGTVIGVRRARERRGTTLGAPASWPPLEPSPESPVAALGDLATDRAPSPATSTSTSASASASAPAWTPASDSAGPAMPAEPASPQIESPFAETAGAWVAPLEDGSCPLGHPIKANNNSGIFHEPGGRFYARTRAERCYVDAAAAAADGYRPAKGANDREVTD